MKGEIQMINLNLANGMLCRYLQTGKLPDIWNISDLNSFDQIRFRNEYTSKLGFALISNVFINILRGEVIQNGKCLEIMSGTGALSKALSDLGVDIISTDNSSWYDFPLYKLWKTSKVFNIENIDCVNAIEKYGKDVDFIICSWPPYDEPQAARSLDAMRQVNPNCKMIYIGENRDGCTANDEFFNKWKDVCEPEQTNKYFENFYGIHDRVYVLN